MNIERHVRHCLFAVLVGMTVSACGSKTGPDEPCCVDLAGKWVLKSRNSEGVVQTVKLVVTQEEQSIEGTGTAAVEESSSSRVEKRKTAAAGQESSGDKNATDAVAKSQPRQQEKASEPVKGNATKQPEQSVEMKGSRDGAKVEFVVTGAGFASLKCDGVIDFVDSAHKTEYRAHLAGKGKAADEAVDWEAGLERAEPSP